MTMFKAKSAMSYIETSSLEDTLSDEINDRQDDLSVKAEDTQLNDNQSKLEDTYQLYTKLVDPKRKNVVTPQFNAATSTVSNL